MQCGKIVWRAHRAGFGVAVPLASSTCFFFYSYITPFDPGEVSTGPLNWPTGLYYRARTTHATVRTLEVWKILKGILKVLVLW